MKIDGWEKSNMRSDYALYAVAIIFFILTGITLAYKVESQELWIISTFVLGLFFIGLGYSQRPRAQEKTVTVEAPPPPTPAAQEPVVQAVQETVEKPAPTVKGLTEVKGIGEKRAEQLKTIGVNTVEDLAKASADDLAVKLKVSPKITKVWIENAKKLVEKS
jgi:predicted flap endonuclease-1-like 5' DNA nuclease